MDEIQSISQDNPAPTEPKHVEAVTETPSVQPETQTVPVTDEEVGQNINLLA